jgi:hypothetical protein
MLLNGQQLADSGQDDSDCRGEDIWEGLLVRLIDIRAAHWMIRRTLRRHCVGAWVVGTLCISGSDGYAIYYLQCANEVVVLRRNSGDKAGDCEPSRAMHRAELHHSGRQSAICSVSREKPSVEDGPQLSRWIVRIHYCAHISWASFRRFPGSEGGQSSFDCY